MLCDNGGWPKAISLSNCTLYLLVWNYLKMYVLSFSRFAERETVSPTAAVSLTKLRQKVFLFLCFFLCFFFFLSREAKVWHDLSVCADNEVFSSWGVFGTTAPTSRVPSVCVHARACALSVSFPSAAPSWRRSPHYHTHAVVPHPLSQSVERAGFNQTAMTGCSFPGLLGSASLKHHFAPLSQTNTLCLFIY